MREDWCVPMFVDHVDRKPVARFHQDIQINPIWVYREPPGMVLGRRSVETVDEYELARPAIFLVSPDLITFQVGRIEVGLSRIEDHSVDSRLGAILVVLNVRFHTAALVDRENIAVAGVIVEWIAIYIVRCFLCC